MEQEGTYSMMMQSLKLKKEKYPNPTTSSHDKDSKVHYLSSHQRFMSEIQCSRDLKEIQNKMNR